MEDKILIRMCRCGRHPLPHRRRRCDECNNEKVKEHNAKVTMLRKQGLLSRPVKKCYAPPTEPQVEQFKPWTPRPKPAPLMTDAEQKRHDEALAARLNEACGYGHGAVKRLSKKEIAALAAEIVPLDRIRRVPLDVNFMWFR